MSNVNDSQYDLFFNYHYTVEVKQSLRPIFSSKGMIFPSHTIIKKRKLSVVDKLRYYLFDFYLYMKERKK